MPEHTRIDVADRLDAALDSDLPLAHFDRTDPLGELVALGGEVRTALHRPSLSVTARARIHERALELAGSHPGLRRGWPQLPQVHPAVVGGAAAAVLAAAGLVALRGRRGHGAAAVLGAA